MSKYRYKPVQKVNEDRWALREHDGYLGLLSWRRTDVVTEWLKMCFDDEELQKMTKAQRDAAWRKCKRKDGVSVVRAALVEEEA